MLKTVSDSSLSSVEVRSERVLRIPEVAFAVTVLLLVTIRIAEGYDTFTHHPGTDWGVSDWMIRYADGFVRRGLGGSLLAGLMSLTGFGFFSILVSLTTGAYLMLCATLVRTSARLPGPAIWRFALLFNPILLISASDYGTISRKDIVFLCATLLWIWFASRVPARGDKPSAEPTRSIWFLLVFFALLSTGLALLHEGIFAFAWLPLNATILAFVLKRTGRRPRSILPQISITLLPAIVAIAACAHWHGDVRTADAICSSWSSAMPLNCASGSSFPVALGALTWSLGTGVRLSLSFALWFPFYLLFLILGGTLEILAVRVLMPEARLEHLVSVLALPFLASLPLYLLGIDWGRWLSLVAISSLFVMLSPSLRPCAYEALPMRARNVIHEKLVPWLDHILDWLRPRIEREPWLLGAALLLIPVPPIPARNVLLLDPPFVLISFLMHYLR